VWTYAHLLEYAKTLVAVAALMLACYQDVKTREIDDKVWYIMAGVGLPIAVLQVLLRRDPLYAMAYLVSAAVGTVLAFTVYWARLMGGADAKALIAISVIEIPAPWRGILATTPSLAVLTNAVLLSALTPLAMAVRNLVLLRGKLWKGLCPDEPLWKRVLAVLVLTKVPIRTYRQKPHAFVLAENRDRGCVSLVFNLSAPEEEVPPPSDLPDEEEVWVSYLLPYILAIAGGYIIYKLVGPILEIALVGGL